MISSRINAVADSGRESGLACCGCSLTDGELGRDILDGLDCESEDEAHSDKRDAKKRQERHSLKPTLQVAWTSAHRKAI